MSDAALTVRELGADDLHVRSASVHGATDEELAAMGVDLGLLPRPTAGVGAVGVQRGIERELLHDPGFCDVRTHVAKPGAINSEQPVTRWVLER